MMNKCIMIYNPNSGKGKVKNNLSDIVNLIKSYKYNVTVIETKYKRNAIEIVSELDDDVDLVMSFGGDGTFNEIMRGNFIRKKQLVIAHIPVGTTNDVGVMFGYGKNILQNIKDTLEGSVKEIDICMINNIPFIYVAGFGKYMDISYDTPSSMKRKFGYFAYIKEGVKVFFNKTKLYDMSYMIAW